MRMGGIDKGLQPFLGQPLAAHALDRLAPQVGHLMLNANRHAEAYAQLGAPYGAPVWPDAEPDYPGPLAGFLSGLTHCQTPWLVCVPCDTPLFPRTLYSGSRRLRWRSSLRPTSSSPMAGNARLIQINPGCGPSPCSA